jgi:hypothetical protein
MTEAPGTKFSLVGWQNWVMHRICFGAGTRKPLGPWNERGMRILLYQSNRVTKNGIDSKK